jgi:Uma2 family endonuclease
MAEVLTESTISFQKFLKVYDGCHAEWIMGRVEALGSSTILHQNILLFLITLLELFLGFNSIGELFVVNFTMFVGEDKPAREPDLMIVLNAHRDRIKQTFLDGPADIAIEIVAPESSERDRGTKFDEYEAAGVEEYWLFDPLRQQADIHVLTPISETESRYRRVELDTQGRLISTLLPGFALNPAILWQEEMPTGAELIQMVQNMVGEKTK